MSSNTSVRQSFLQVEALESRLLLDGTPPVIVSLDANPDPITRGGALTLTANDVSDNVSVASVEFYYDVNGNSTIEVGVDLLLGADADAAGGWTITGDADDTKSLPLGANTFMARALDGEGDPGNTVTVVVTANNALPTIDSLDATATAARGDTITLTANGVADIDGTIANVKFYLDVNGDGSLDGGDTLVGTDADAAGGYTATVVTDGTWTLGENKFLAVATDSDASASAAVTDSTTVTNVAPTIVSLDATASVARGDTITLTANGAANTNSTIANVKFYLDVDGDGTVNAGDTLLGTDADAAGGYTATVVTDGTWTLGENKFLAVATDSDGDASAAVTDSTTVTNVVPTIASLDATATAARGDTITLTANGVADIDGTIANVEFYLDADGDGTVSAGDTLVGTDANAAGGYTASVVTDGTWTLGENKFLAVATDSDADASAAVTDSTTVTNVAPTIVSLDATASVARGDSITLTANGAADTDGTIANVKFYLDVDGDGTVNAGDTLLGTDADSIGGYTATVVTDGTWELGEAKFLAVATDSDDDASELVTADSTVENALPVLGGLSADSPVIAGDTVELSADDAADSDGTIANVKFYLDLDGDGTVSAGDTLLGTDSDGSDGYSYSFVVDGTWPAGEYQFLAIGIDNDGGETAPATATVLINSLPTMTGLDAPDEVVRGDSFTLTALDTDDSDGTVQSVDFYFDVNGDGLLDEGDELLGTDTDGDDGWSFQADSSGMDLGEARFLAAATDDLGYAGAAQAASVTVLNVVPTISDFAADSDTVTRGDELTISVTADDLDGTIDHVNFYFDTNGNGTWDQSDELLATASEGDWSYSPDTQSLALGENTFFAIAVDNDGDASEPASAVVTVENALPAVDTLTSGSDSVSRGQEMTLTAIVSDTDGTIANVKFYLDVDGSGDVGEEDILLGTDSAGTGGWTWTGDTADFAIGDNTVLAVATDNDGGASDPVSTSIAADYYSLTWTNPTGNVTITAYDASGVVDISLSNIAVKWGRGDAVTSITLKGQEGMGGLVLVVEGATSVGGITDARKGDLDDLGDVAMIYADCGVAKMTILGNLAGYDPAEFGLSVDSASENVAVYVGGAGGNLQVNGDLGGDVEIDAGLTSLKVLGATDSTMDITQALDGKKTMQLTFGDVTSLALTTDVPVKALTMGTVTSAQLTVDGVVSSVKTLTWSDGGIDAFAITKMTVTGNLSAAINVTNALNAKDKMTTALGTLSVSGAIDGSQILSAGTIGTVTAGAIRNSNIFAGVNAAVTALPTDYLDFDILTIAQAAAINSVKVNGQSGQTYSYENSSIAAAKLGTVSLKDVRFDTFGTADEFGLAGTSLKSYTRYEGKVKAAKANGFPTVSDDSLDFVVRELLAT